MVSFVFEYSDTLVGYSYPYPCRYSENAGVIKICNNIYDAERERWHGIAIFVDAFDSLGNRRRQLCKHRVTYLPAGIHEAMKDVRCVWSRAQVISILKVVLRDPSTDDVQKRYIDNVLERLMIEEATARGRRCALQVITKYAYDARSCPYNVLGKLRLRKEYNDMDMHANTI